MGKCSFFLRIIKWLNNRYLIVFILISIISINSCYARTNAGVKEYGLELLGATASELVISIPASFFIAIITIPFSSNISKSSDWEPGDVAAIVQFYFRGACFGGCVGAPLGTIITGKVLHQNGSQLGAYCGGILGTYIGASIVINSHEELGSFRKYWLPMPKLGGETVTIPLALLLPPAVAVAGYNLFPYKKSSSTSMFERYAPQCAFTLRPVDYNNKTTPEIGLKLSLSF